MRLFAILSAGSMGALISALPVTANATVANSGTVNASAFAVASGGVVDSQTATDSAAGLPTSLSAVAVAQSTAPGNGTVDSRTSSTASWTSADAGTITLELARAFSTDPFLGGAQTNNTLRTNWAYNFTATDNGFFNLNYDVQFLPASSGNSAFGLTGWDLEVNGQTVLPLVNFSDPTASGSFSYALTAGTNYVFALVNGSNIGGGVGSSLSGAVDGRFDWSITAAPVPEPASWALMVAGFGLAGAGLRRRRALLAI